MFECLRVLVFVRLCVCVFVRLCVCGFLFVCLRVCMFVRLRSCVCFCSCVCICEIAYVCVHVYVRDHSPPIVNARRTTYRAACHARGLECDLGGGPVSGASKRPKFLAQHFATDCPLQFWLADFGGRNRLS